MFIAILTTVTAVTAIFFPAIGESASEALDLLSSGFEFSSDVSTFDTDEYGRPIYKDYSGLPDFAPHFTGDQSSATISPYIGGNPLSPLPASSSSSEVESFNSTQQTFIEDIEEMFRTPTPQAQVSPLNIRRVPKPLFSVRDIEAIRGQADFNTNHSEGCGV